MELDSTLGGRIDPELVIIVNHSHLPLKGLTHAIEADSIIGAMSLKLRNFYESAINQGASEVIIENAGYIFPEINGSRCSGAYLVFRNFVESAGKDHNVMTHILEPGKGGKIDYDDLMMRYRCFVLCDMRYERNLYQLSEPK